MDTFRELMGNVGLMIEALGVLVIVIGVIIGTGRFLFRRKPTHAESYQCYRQDVGRAILLGLEFLIAGDIIHTVAVQPTLDSVSVLGLIVLIRVLLGIALHLEIEGRWPWQPPNGSGSLALPGTDERTRG